MDNKAPKTRSMAKPGPDSGFARDDIVPMLGIGVETDCPVSLESHIASAAADIKKTLAETAKAGGFKTRDYGVATTLHGLWIKDGSESRYETNILNMDQLHSVVANYHNQGFRPIDLLGSGRLFEPWSVVFGPRHNLGYYWYPNADENGFRQKDMELFEAGFRITSFNRRNGNFNGTWGPGDGGAQWIRWDMDWFALQAWDSHFKSEGLRIATIDRYGSGGTLYAAAWRPGSGEQIIEAPGGINTYFGQPQNFNVFKYKDRGLEVHAMGHNGFAVAAYRPKVGSYKQQWIYLPPSDFREFDESCRRDGFRMTFLSHAAWQIG
jgi:hypothetical protein